MKPRSDLPGLLCLDRCFRASYSGHEVKQLFPGSSTSLCIKMGILSDLGMSDTIPFCVCDLKRPSCNVIVQADSEGTYWGHCNEYGSPIKVSPDLLRRYAFNWEAWADWLRRENGIAGTGPGLGKGCLYVGLGSAGGRRYRLAVVAPGCSDAADVMLPPESLGDQAPLVLLALGNIPEADLDGHVIAASDVLDDDLVTLDTDHLEAILVDAPIVLQDRDLTYRCFTKDDSKGRPITEAECERLRRKESRDKYDIFVDLLVCKVWRKDRACGSELDSKGHSTGKKLGEKSVRLLGDYVKRPGHAMAPNRTPTYQRTSITPRSAVVRFSAARRSIRGNQFLQHAASGANPGEGTYVFEPGEMTYCLVERIE